MKWPPGPKTNLAAWTNEMKGLGEKWRRSWTRQGDACEVPQRVAELWKSLLSHWSIKLMDTDVNQAEGLQREIAETLLQLMAIADESCVLVGFAHMSSNGVDSFNQSAINNLSSTQNSSLCQQIQPSRLSVLPKSHTPQTGFTIRSLSHHLAMYSGEMRPRWEKVPLQTKDKKLNLLLVPFPYDIAPKGFLPFDLRAQKMPGKYGYFTFDLKAGNTGAEDIKALLEEIFQKAKLKGRHIDVVVFPELALTEHQLADAREFLSQKSLQDTQIRLLLCGVGEKANASRSGSNRAHFELVLPNETIAWKRQSKHHRWQLDKSQIDRYGFTALQPALDSQLWWECIDLNHRDLSILACSPLLTLCVLICEDLARPDPVGELVRAIGPNLIIALLADAPQLVNRWPGKYASVLSDDPGSSVLTLTSLGMVKLSASKRSTKASKTDSRVVALWSQAGKRPRQIALQKGKRAVLLELEIENRTEYTADGRDDRSLAGDVRFLSADSL